MIKEFCAENLTLLPSLDASQVSRVELCDNLAVGGTTPSYGVIKEACQLLHDKHISVATMIRPRGGDFVYNDLELKAMEEDPLGNKPVLQTKPPPKLDLMPPKIFFLMDYCNKILLRS